MVIVQTIRLGDGCVKDIDLLGQYSSMSRSIFKVILLWELLIITSKKLLQQYEKK